MSSRSSASHRALIQVLTNLTEDISECRKLVVNRGLIDASALVLLISSSSPIRRIRLLGRDVVHGIRIGIHLGILSHRIIKRCLDLPLLGCLAVRARHVTIIDRA